MESVVIKAQSGPDNHYMYVVASRPSVQRRAARSRNVKVRGPVIAEDEWPGSVAKAFLVGVPLSIALWVPIIWGAFRIL